MDAARDTKVTLLRGLLLLGATAIILGTALRQTTGLGTDAHLHLGAWAGGMLVLLAIGPFMRTTPILRPMYWIGLALALVDLGLVASFLLRRA
jgi:hypothetical protein